MPLKTKTKTKKKNTTSRKTRRDFWHKQFHVINVDPFNTQVSVAVNMTEAETINTVLECINSHDNRHTEREKKFLTEFSVGVQDWDDCPHALGRMIPAGSSYVILLRFDKNKFREAVGLLTHEVTHVVQYLLRDRRTPMSEDTEEVYAYLMQWLTQEILYRLYE